MSKPDQLSNLGTSRVFLSMIKGRKNPKSIADFLGIQPPPVIEQLRRLQKIDVVKLGGKEGKRQNYEIKWNDFLRLFIDRAIQAPGKKNARDDMKIEGISDESIEKIRSLKNNGYFRIMVESYLQNVAGSEPAEWITVNSAIDYFERALRTVASFKRSRKFQDQEKQEFFDNMKAWYNKTLSAETWMDLNLHDAILKTLKEE